jgi:hypothetical protein
MKSAKKVPQSFVSSSSRLSSSRNSNMTSRMSSRMATEDLKKTVKDWN